MQLIAAAQKDEALLADIQDAPRDESTFSLWWLGQSGFLIAWNGHHLLLDPYLSDSLTEKYAATDKPHIRMTELSIAPEKLGFLDVVTSSHNHTDHLDAETLLPLFAANPELQFVLPAANCDFAAQRLACDQSTFIGLNDGESVQVGAFRFHGIAAAHETLATDEAGRHKFLGFVVQFGPHTVYHSGDCVLYKGLGERLHQFDIDLALLPINGSMPERRVSGNFSGREAAQLAKNIGAEAVIPCHYDMFTFNTESPEEFVATCQSIGQKYFVLRCGERWDSGLLGN
jgi:L-ascorbate metabolism protein UlaG (beta-lactamase superfamily)